MEPQQDLLQLETPAPEPQQDLLQPQQQPLQQQQAQRRRSPRIEEAIGAAHRALADGSLHGLQAARSQVLALIEDPPMSKTPELEEADLEGLLEVLGLLNDALDSAQNGPPASADSGVGSSGAVPPPPSEAPPDREQQEQYDLILARYLQERENELFVDIEREDAALARRLAMEEEGGFQVQQGAVAMPPAGRDSGAPRMVRCSQCGTMNQLRGSGSGVMICYVCGFTQRLPAMGANSNLHARAQQLPQRPARHAPPPRVINGADAPELLIKTGGVEDVDLDVGASDSAAQAAPSGGSSFKASGHKAGGHSEEFDSSFSEGLLGGGGGSIAQGKTSKSWAKSMSSWAPNASAGSLKRLGDGVPDSEYTAMGEEIGSLFGGPPKSTAKKSSLGWSKSRKRSDVEQSLLERVKVDGEWELIRPPEERPYWYNSTTQVSQWEPPEVVRQGGS